MKLKLVTLALAVAAAGTSFATQLVTNGDFEAGSAGWTESSGGGFVIIGDWSGSVVDGAGDLGPPTMTAWLGGYESADDSVTQSISTVSGGTATLDFDYYFANEDVAGFDFLTVSLGGVQLGEYDLGNDDAVALNGPIHITLDVSSMMDGSAQDLAFRVTTDSSLNSSAFIDNVSLVADSVPEPATMAVLALGVGALVRRRKA
ncbi:MAG: PEP-CTERM sorting domain-containing protein [Fimbriimonadaceae bacterium]|nr:PEP-CTERM sorting domain-containing protein [Fimbriimonadaceae bacterium]